MDKRKDITRFDVDFKGNCEMKTHIHRNGNSESSVSIPIYDIADMIETICDDIDMVRLNDMRVLKEAIDRFNHLTEVED